MAGIFRLRSSAMLDLLLKLLILEPEGIDIIDRTCKTAVQVDAAHYARTLCG
jgi:hypothetical protein